MSDDVRLEINEAELRRVLNGPALDATEQRAHRVADQARADAPVVSGAYRNGITVERVDGQVRVGSTVRYAKYVEADHGTLARAVDAAR